MYRKSCTGIVHQVYYSHNLTQNYGRHIYLTSCRNMPTDSELWSRVDYEDLTNEDHNPCKLCLTKLAGQIGYAIRVYSRLFGNDLNSSYLISENAVPRIVAQIKGE